MLRRRIGHISFLLLLILVLCVWVAAEELAWYCRPYGTVNYRGELAPDGLKVVAFINGTELASCETENGEYSLAIPRDDSATPEKEGWAEGDVVNITVGGFSAVPSFKAFEGKERINLYLPTLDVKLTTWGKIKALFR